MSDPYLGEPLRRKAAKPTPKDDVLTLSLRSPEAPAWRAGLFRRRAGDWPVLGLMGLALAWAALQAVSARPPKPLAPVNSPEIASRVVVDVAAIAKARGRRPTWKELFAIYGLERSVQERTLNLDSNSEGGHAPDVDAPIHVNQVTIVLSS